MPRSNRRRPVEHDDSLDRLMAGWKRTEMRRGAECFVQPVAAAKAVKDYTCPGCGRTVLAGVAHLVAWRADGVLGDTADLRDRRHWHEHCWRLA